MHAGFAKFIRKGSSEYPFQASLGHHLPEWPPFLFSTMMHVFLMLAMILATLAACIPAARH